MRKNYKKIILVFGIIVLILLALSISLPVRADVDPGCDPTDPTCPIDGGVSVLVAIGIGLGYKKNIKKK